MPLPSLFSGSRPPTPSKRASTPRHRSTPPLPPVVLHPPLISSRRTRYSGFGGQFPCPACSPVPGLPLPQASQHHHSWVLTTNTTGCFSCVADIECARSIFGFGGSKSPPPLVLAFPTSHSLNYHGTPIPCVFATTLAGRFSPVANIECVHSIFGFGGQNPLSHSFLPFPPPTPSTTMAPPSHVSLL